jgi:hypothetical protein
VVRGAFVLYESSPAHARSRGELRRVTGRKTM